MNHNLKYNFLLMLAALIWGSAFVAQSVGMDYLGPFSFNCVRSFMGSLVLLPVIWFMDRQKKETAEHDGQKTEEGTREQNKKVLLSGGLCCGVILTLSTSLQQIGIKYTTAGKAGFITALYILIVPLLGLILGKKVGNKTWLGVALAVAGMYLLCIKEGFSISYGDFMVLLCALVFSLHILAVDYFSPRVDGIRLSCIQFFVCGCISAVPMLVWEHPEISQIIRAWQPLAYAGVLSSGVAYTLQIVTQKHLNPTVASLLMSLESVFAVLTGWLVLNERLSLKELLGCVLVFTAIILAQLPQKQKKPAVK
ncbi:MAG: DMT family transporter [Ruminococcus sp.]|jgi:drug/metabolite transporter (DMT)-like permease|nr:DMT family transporter [uncultured Schaedlerella sp.]MCI8766708.1 DMT family transporter [Ruminococcus sp.]MCI9329683.1 DMT family transporter [Ruminococcus sp.]NBJ01892.1 DMT family transporter [Lachnospiraceae bacterium]